MKVNSAFVYTFCIVCRYLYEIYYNLLCHTNNLSSSHFQDKPDWLTEGSHDYYDTGANDHLYRQAKITFLNSHVRQSSSYDKCFFFQGPCHSEPFLRLWAGLRPVRLQPGPTQTNTTTWSTIPGFTVTHLPDWVWQGIWSWRLLQWLLRGASEWLSRSSIKDSLTIIHQHDTIQAVQRIQGRTWWQGLEVPLIKLEAPLIKVEVPLIKVEVPLNKVEAPLNKVEVPLRRLRSPAEVFLRIGRIEEEMMGRGEVLWRRVRRQQKLLLLRLLFHMQFLMMFSSLSRAW